MISWRNFLENLTRDSKDEGYNFNQKAEMNIETITNKKDYSYDFYIKHNMDAVEWKLNAMVNKNIKFNQTNRS